MYLLTSVTIIVGTRDSCVDTAWRNAQGQFNTVKSLFSCYYYVIFV